MGESRTARNSAQDDGPADKAKTPIGRLAFPGTASLNHAPRSARPLEHITPRTFAGHSMLCPYNCKSPTAPSGGREKGEREVADGAEAGGSGEDCGDGVDGYGCGGDVTMRAAWNC